MMKTPIPNSYWVIPGKFLAGEYPGAKQRKQAVIKVRALLDRGINLFVDLTDSTREHWLKPYREILVEEWRYRDDLVFRLSQSPIVDLGVPSKPEMVGILDTIDRGLDEGMVVYLHCMGGVGRTGTVVGCWLVRHGMTGSEALQQIARWWQGVEKAYRAPQSPETAEQREFVLGWPERERPQYPEVLAIIVTDPSSGTR